MVSITNMSNLPGQEFQSFLIIFIFDILNFFIPECDNISISMKLNTILLFYASKMLIN